MKITTITAYKVFNSVFESEEEASEYLASSKIINTIAGDSGNFPEIWNSAVFASYVLRHGAALYDILSGLYATCERK